METRGQGQGYWKRPSATGFSEGISGGREVRGVMGFKQVYPGDLGWKFHGVWEAEARLVVG